MNDDLPNLKRSRRAAIAARADDSAVRLPPHSIEAEQGVLGCILLSPADCLGACRERLGKDNEVFYDLRHQAVFNLMLRMEDERQAIDLITLHQRLKDLNQLEAVGGFAYLAGLPDAVPSAANLAYYLDIVREKHQLRQLIRICTDTVQQVYTFEGAAEKLMVDAESRISALTEVELPRGEEHIKMMLPRVIDQAEAHYKRGSQQLMGLPTGPPGNYMDKRLNGIRDTFYAVLAGRPGDGKSSLAMNWVEYLATDYHWREETGKTLKSEAGEEYPETVERKGIPIGVFSIEMDGDSLVWRMLFGRAGVDMATFQQGFVKEGYEKKLTTAAAQLSGSNIYIDCTPAQTIGQIAAKARRMVKQYGIKLFVLDYLQLVETDGGNGFDRVKELTKISRKIMALKKQLRVPWLVLCQMNRNIETSERTRPPMLSDLKDCGAIEQDADVVVFLQKPDRKTLEKKGGDKELLDALAEREGWSWAQQPYRMNAFVAKHRFGATGVVNLVFQKNLCRFHDWHLFKLEQGLEELKKGERPAALGLPTNEEMDL